LIKSDSKAIYNIKKIIYISNKCCTSEPIKCFITISTNIWSSTAAFQHW